MEPAAITCINHPSAFDTISTDTVLAPSSPPAMAEDPSPIDSQLKQYLECHGIRPVTWRLLCRTGTQWMHEFLVYYRRRSRPPIHPSVLVDLLTITQAFGSQRLVPPWMLHAILQIGGNPNAPSSRYADRLDDIFPVCKRLGILWERADAEAAAVLQDRAVEIFRWASDYACSFAQGTLRKATLPWLIRKVDEAAVRERLQVQGAQGWYVPYRLDPTETPQTSQRTDLHAVILNTPLAIWQEGQTMRHCAKNYTDQCARGQVLMVSLRRPSKRVPMATVAYDLLDPGIRIKVISGFANSAVDRATYKVARAYASNLQLQKAELRLTHTATVTHTPREVA